MPPSSDGGSNHPGPQLTPPPASPDELAETGSSAPLGVIVPAAAGMLLAGSLVYRRTRRGA
ncbi:hypothetical protein ACIP27_24905 [Streptomyces hydrogenans]|uniref:hypothetical protein n=1 Tax=Streptomyces hydrogenans TaxID=1873719 RepID=UPI0038181907